MNTRSFLIPTAILLFGVSVTIGLLSQSTSDTKTDSSKAAEGATGLGAKRARAAQSKPPTVNVTDPYPPHLPMTHAPFSIPDPRKQIPFSNLSGLITLDADTANALAEFKCSKLYRNALGCLSFTQGSALGSVSQRGNDGGHSAHGAMRRMLR